MQAAVTVLAVKSMNAIEELDVFAYCHIPAPM